MAEPGRAGERVAAWDAARRRRAFVWPARLTRTARTIAERLRAWAIAEIAPGRLMPWLPVAFIAGIAAYFTAEREPALVAALLLAGGCIVAAVLARRRAVGFPVLLGLAAATAGFATATLKSTRVAHPVLAQPAWNVTIAGWVEVREERARTDRIAIRVHRIEGARLGEALERVRVAVRKGTAPPVGSFVELKARLTPPLAPLRPGGYDFARDLYFQGIGATGFALGAIRLAEAPVAPGRWLGYAAFINGIRDAIDRRIRASLPGDAGAIASALITGKRDAISESVNEAMYVSGLGHVLSISGYHMALVAGVVFFALRAGFALFPALALRHAIKKWSALAALIAAACYLALSGAEVATQRAFIMTAIVLVGVMADRPALTLRNLALACFAVLAIAPEAVVHPSFQMSFAATLALVAAYERGQPWLTAGADTAWSARIALWGGRQIAAVMLASVVAGLATTLYAAYHFQRLAPFGVLANLLAMPLVSLIAMPAGLRALIALPFGFDGLMWRLMGLGIDWMTAVAVWVAGLPGAVGRIPAFGIGPVLLGTAGIVVLCLLRTPLRWGGAVLVAVTVLWAAYPPRPDVLVAPGGEAFAVRTRDGLTIMNPGRDQFAVRAWLAADGDAREPKDPALANGFTCDAIGCIAKLPDGALVSVALAAEAFEEDCARAAVVLSRREAPPFCQATVIDRNVWRKTGAMAVYRSGAGFDVVAARPATQDRPWARGAVSAGTGEATTPARLSVPRDATPRQEDIGPED